MDLESTIKELLYKQPLKCGNRSEALSYLYCEIDNGYIWHRGQLVTVVSRDFFSPPEFDDEYIARKAKEWTVSEGVIRKYVEEDKRTVEYVRNNIDELCMTAPIPDRVHTITELSNIKNIPSNVEKQWLDGAIELLDIVSKLDTRHHEYNRCNAENVRKAIKIRSNLKKRFSI